MSSAAPDQNPFAGSMTSGPPQPVYQPGMQFTTKSPQQVEADKASQASLIFGILGFFFLGIVFGPLAIWKAKQAEELGAAATAGKILGWIATIFGLLGLLFFILMFMGVLGLGASSL